MYARRTRTYRRRKRSFYPRRSMLSKWGLKRRKFGYVNLRNKRLPRRQARKRYIRNVASKKKWDTMRSAGDVVSGDLDAQITLEDAVTIFLFCPNYRNLDRDVSNDHTRNAQDVYFRGFKEKFWVQTSQVPLVHRRIVFWCQQVIDNARPHVVPVTNSPPTYYRSFTPIQGNSFLMQYLFQGTPDTDYSNLFWPTAKLDRRNCQVISDTTKITNPGNDTGTQKLYSTWVGVNRRMSYPDEERGSGEQSNPWAAPTPYGKGNIYVMDMFSQGFEPPPVGEAATFTTQSTVYWHEA